MKKSRKGFKLICGIFSFLGFVFLLGTVGAIENDSIPLWCGMIRAGVGLALFVGGGFLGGFMK